MVRKPILIILFLLFSAAAYAECFTAYFVIPTGWVNQMQMTIDNGDVLIDSGNLDSTKYYEVVSTVKDFPTYKVGRVFTGKNIDITGKGIVKEVNIVKEGHLDPTKYYEVMAITGYIGDYVVGDRFTGISADITDKGIVKEVSNIYPLIHRKFDAEVVGTTNTGKKVVHLILKRHWLKEVKRLIRADDITTNEALELSKIKRAYIGRTRADVIARFPELAGTTGIGDDIIPRLMKHRWSCE